MFYGGEPVHKERAVQLEFIRLKKWSLFTRQVIKRSLRMAPLSSHVQDVARPCVFLTRFTFFVSKSAKKKRKRKRGWREFLNPSLSDLAAATCWFRLFSRLLAVNTAFWSDQRNDASGLILFFSSYKACKKQQKGCKETRSYLLLRRCSADLAGSTGALEKVAWHDRHGFATLAFLSWWKRKAVQ